MPTLTHQDKYYISLKYDRRTISFASDDCSSTSVSVEISMDPSRHGAYRPNFGTVLAVDAPSMFLVPRRTPSAPIPVMWDRSVVFICLGRLRQTSNGFPVRRARIRRRRGRGRRRAGLPRAGERGPPGPGRDRRRVPARQARLSRTRRAGPKRRRRRRDRSRRHRSDRRGWRGRRGAAGPCRVSRLRGDRRLRVVARRRRPISEGVARRPRPRGPRSSARPLRREPARGGRAERLRLAVLLSWRCVRELRRLPRGRGAVATGRPHHARGAGGARVPALL